MTAADEQLYRDVADIRVAVAETVIRVRAIERADRATERETRSLRRRVNALERWRWILTGVWLAVGFLLDYAFRVFRP